MASRRTEREGKEEECSNQAARAKNSGKRIYYSSDAAKSKTASKPKFRSRANRKPPSGLQGAAAGPVKKRPSEFSSNKGYSQQSNRKGRVEPWKPVQRVNIPSMSNAEIKSLCKPPIDSSQLTSQLSSRIKGFQSSLQNSNMLERPGMMETIVFILHKVSECLTKESHCSDENESSHSQALRILGEVLSDRCSKFQLHLQVYVQRDLIKDQIITPRRKRPASVQSVYTSSHERASSVCSLFRSLLEVIPDSSWAVLPVHELVSMIKKSPSVNDLVAEAESIEALYKEMHDRQQSTHPVNIAEVEPEWDHAEYREQPILPQKDEVCLPSPPERLRPNIVEGSYIDWMHYYDVQFCLLREDFVAPLRRGICGYIGGARGRELQDVKAYNEVTFSAPLFARQGVCYEINFDVSRLQRCRWEHSKRLLFGSLLCISPDNFHSTVLFATVADRDANELKKGKIKVRFEEESAKMLTYCNQANVQKFTMVESTAYFEASRHILHSLQIAEVATMPFTPYLIQNEWNEVGMPKYLDDIPVANYNLNCLKGNEANTTSINTLPVKPASIFFANEVTSSSEDSSDDSSGGSSSDSDEENSSPSKALPQQGPVRRKNLTFDIKNFSQWPGTDEVELDQSQLHAIQMALTQEVAVIQGPPGTGKTYVGLKITEALLKNRAIWDPNKESPIFVMCFTNHALDQFLEGLVRHYVGDQVSETNLRWLSRAPKIVRIGGRGRNDLVQLFNINKVLHKLRPVPSATHRHMKQCQRAVSDCSEEIVDRHLKEYFLAKKCQRKNQLLYPDKLNRANIISQNHFYQMNEILDSREERRKALELWLGTCEIQTHTKEVPREVSPARAVPLTATHSHYYRNTEEKVQELSVNSQPVIEQTESEDTTEIIANTEQEMDESQNEELIDVQGEAMIEQGARMLDDDDDFQVRCIEESELESESLLETNGPSNFTKKYVNSRYAHTAIQDEPDSSHSDSGSDDEDDIQYLEDVYDQGATLNGTSLGVFTHSDIESLSDEDEDEIRGFGNVNETVTGAGQLSTLRHPDSPTEIPSDSDDEEEIQSLTQPDLQMVDRMKVASDTAHENNGEHAADKVDSDNISYIDNGPGIANQEFTPVDYDSDYVKPKPVHRVPVENAQTVNQQPNIAKLPRRQKEILKPKQVDVFAGVVKDTDPKPLLPQSSAQPNHRVNIEEQTLKRVIEYTQVTVRQIIDRPNAYKISKRGHQQTPMTEEEANRVENIQSLSHNDRWKLYNYWVSEYLKHLLEVNEEKFEEYDRLCRESNEAKKQADRYALETAEVIGMTTTGAAKYQHILHLVKPKIVIVEEAAEVLESHIVSALNAGTQHLILIGDHKQLRPKPNDYQLAKKYHLDISLFERLVRNNFPHATLEIQHRMRPEIAQLVKPHIYKTLINHHSVEQYDRIRGVEKNLFFIQHEHPETGDEHLLSHSNLHEAKFLAALCNYFLQQGYKPSQVTILVTYTGQLLKMRDHLPKKIFEGVRVCTVDNFQGEENDIILLSLVRSNDAGRIGFLFEENRVCVSLSRARMGLYCIGNIAMLRKKALIWDVIMSDMETKGYLGDSLPLGCANHPSNKFSARVPEDFERNAPKGGCQEDCNYRLPCGHACRFKCHIVDPEHEQYQCLKDCTRKCPAPEAHSSCTLKCFEVCGRCNVTVERELQCGHSKVMKCFVDPISIRCQRPCPKMCDSGHPCPKKCYEDCGNCEKIVTKTIEECGHEIDLPCWIPPEHQYCTLPCEKILSCGHQCQSVCGKSCTLRCLVKVEKIMEKCRHKLTLPCWTPPYHGSCTLPCEETLQCGHQCQQECGKVCILHPCEVKVEKRLDCDHIIIVSCSKSSLPVTCDKPCERKLNPCGHGCPKICSQPCTKHCRVIVEKEWPCGHKLKRQCYQAQNPDQYPCFEPCTKKLPCGHPCTEKCSQLCTVKCLYPSQAKTCPNGHKWKRRCFQAAEPDKYPCKEKCQKNLSCGHPCPGRCGEDCTKYTYECRVLVYKALPCGHERLVPCSTTDSSPCTERCNYTLACGHKCEGSCSHCSLSGIHEPCQYGVDSHKQFCGHHDDAVRCLDIQKISHSRKQKQCTAYCPHKKCTHNCSTPCKPCTEPCAWNCPHHQCNKLCHEVCKRPQCNERCENLLKCGHQCYGLCGEPCLTICPECKLKDFNKLVKKDLNGYPGEFDQTKLYVQLGCNHIFALEVMDSHAELHEYKPISPLQCPDSRCEHPALCSSYRYGNIVKKSLSEINAVRNEVTAQHQAVIPDNIRDSRKALDAIFVDYMQDKQSEQGTSRKLYNQLTKAGWYTESKRGSRVRIYRWYRYKPQPRNTGDLIRLQLQLSRNKAKTNQELHILHLLMSTLKLQCIVYSEDLKKVTLSEITYTSKRNIKRQVATLFNCLLSLRIEPYHSRLSAQLIHDLQSEMYRVTLLVQYCLVKKSLTIPPPDVADFLRQCAQTSSFQVNRSEFCRYSSMLAGQHQTTAISACLDEVKLIVTPLVLKGTWWKCPNGHYYCVPLTMAGVEEASCPKC